MNFFIGLVTLLGFILLVYLLSLWAIHIENANEKRKGLLEIVCLPDLTYVVKYNGELVSHGYSTFEGALEAFTKYKDKRKRKEEVVKSEEI